MFRTVDSDDVEDDVDLDDILNNNDVTADLVDDINKNSLHSTSLDNKSSLINYQMMAEQNCIREG